MDKPPELERLETRKDMVLQEWNGVCHRGYNHTLKRSIEA